MLPIKNGGILSNKILKQKHLLSLKNRYTRNFYIVDNK